MGAKAPINRLIRKNFVLQEGGKLMNPRELTNVSDRGD